jgi:hypothetical protein
MPLAIEAVELDTANRYLLFRSALGGEPCVGRSTVAEIAGRLLGAGGRTLAAANGDYFSIAAGDTADPLGLQVIEGEIVSAPSGRSALVILKGGVPVICVPTMTAWAERAGQRQSIVAVNEPARSEGLSLFTWRYPCLAGQAGRASSGQGGKGLTGAVLGPITAGLKSHTTYELAVQRVSAGALWAGSPGPPQDCGAAVGRDELLLVGRGGASSFVGALRPGDAVKVRVELRPFGPEIETAVGGGPRIVRAARVAVETENEGFTAAFAEARHPRTAVGIRGRTLYLAAVDGRQPGYSVGMSLPELAELMLGLGCREALNLDGGGSTTLWLRGRVVNSPSGGSERRVANALVVLNSSPIGPPVRLSLAPQQVSALPGARVAISAELEDANCNPLPPSAVGWRSDPRLGRVDEKGVFEAAAVETPQAGFITATAGSMSARVAAVVRPSPARIELQPARILVAPGEKAKLILKALDEKGSELFFSPAAVKWETDAGTVESPGAFRASESAGSGIVRARLGSATAEAQVFVGSARRLVEDFEDISEWRFASWPPEVSGSLRAAPAPGGGGMSACLSYDFSTVEVSRAVYAKLAANIGKALQIHLRVWGDGNGHWLRARILDAQGRLFTLDLAPRVDWKEGWRVVGASIPIEAAFPVMLDSIYLVEIRPEKKTTGAIFLDDLEVEEAAPPLAK